MKLTAILESLLIASEEPISAVNLAKLVRLGASDLNQDHAEIEIINPNNNTEGVNLNHDTVTSLEKATEENILSAINTLNSHYEKSERSFKILERSKGWKLFTLPVYAEFVRQLFPSNKNQRLSGPAMETLAIIAYRQPITKAAMEAVRGVSCDGMIQKLLDRELISINGRADLPGRPLLYQTTDIFFEHFGIKSIEDLPNSGELRKLKLATPKDSKLKTKEEPATLDNKEILNKELPLE